MTSNATPLPARLTRAETEIIRLALAFPEVTEDTPWGHSAFKVRGKTFLFLGADGDGLSLSMKLPSSGRDALELPFTEPTHYGLGKSGWVTARFDEGTEVPLDTVAAWLEESFCAVAPRKLVAARSAETATAKPRRKAKGQ